MRVIYDRLYEKMTEFGITTKELASIAGTNELSIRLKLRGLSEWKLHEAVRICCFFRIADIEHLFSN